MGETCSIKLIMMEFTWHGFVRHGFGFHNPNHAAALICALMPFLWGWKRHPLIGWALSCLLLPPLILTFSRTGLVVLLAELTVWIVLSHKAHWRNATFLAMTALAGAIFGGLGSRFQFDGSIANRPRIWLAGLELAAANPWGVGLGESGRIACSFLLDGIQCRTLVNTHLTLLAEFGMIPGFLWSLFILHAIFSPKKACPAKCSFLGLCLSGCSSSVFDWHILFNRHGTGYPGKMNFLLSWMTLILFLACGVYLIWRNNTSFRQYCVEGVMAAMLVLLPLFLYSPETPHVAKGFACRNTGRSDPVLALYGDDWRFEEVVPFLKNSDCRIPLHGWHSAKTPEFDSLHGAVWLFGYCAEYAPLYPQTKLVFVSPPDYFPLPANTKTVFLKRYSEERLSDFKTEYY